MTRNRLCLTPSTLLVFLSISISQVRKIKSLNAQDSSKKTRNFQKFISMLSRNISNRKSKKDEKKMLTHGPSIPTPINSSYSPYSGNVAKRGAYEDTYVSFYSRVAPRVYCKPNRFVSRLNWGCTRERESHLEQYGARSFSLASSRV